MAVQDEDRAPSPAGTGAGGDASSKTVREVVAVFHDPQKMEDAVDVLTTKYFDYADISVLAGDEVSRDWFGNRLQSVRQLEDDPAAPREAFKSSPVLGNAKGAAISALAYLGAISATGAVVTTGGALAPVIGAAVVAGGGGAAIGTGLARLMEKQQARKIQEQLEAGGLVLWVNVRDETQENRAIEILKAHDGEDVHAHEVPAMV